MEPSRRPFAVGHIATMLVPITNGVDLTFVGGAHIGCKSLYVLADSEYNSTEDLKGTKISVPNGIGASDYNITCLLLDADGINPQTDRRADSGFFRRLRGRYGAGARFPRLC